MDETWEKTENVTNLFY
ncbi:Protein of unknown function [Bacillus cereus]|uniref:Uncharacterized protein n=2 Tax=Bacillus cereus group TaxID=86661 RepID=A0A1C4EMH7_BACTU|nr:Protein of unknown function [Bacillus thuringiensis]SCC46507.1 Protein of unknown function [Bacillus cereus]SCC49234.1 Protein of unknown function [Bacillus wiedmannii]SCL99484.1 Protein of unknown function [Bacillus wiedmannii]SCN05157.1 Protein of unknown function [Bacillus wiedmannii]